MDLSYKTTFLHVSMYTYGATPLNSHACRTIAQGSHTTRLQYQRQQLEKFNMARYGLIPVIAYMMKHFIKIL